ncbi:hypothetical protein PV458_25400 [Streptomyces sp. MN03-5084-2B]|nr:hypothetical protein [Streptomyces sp. MN03-5084-2B]
MSRRSGPSRPKFGKIDPFCLLAVLPMLLVAGILAVLVGVPVGLGVVLLAGLIVVFDSWANRPGPAPARGPRRPVSARPSAGWQPRPPMARPGAPRPRAPVRQPHYRR